MKYLLLLLVLISTNLPVFADQAYLVFRAGSHTNVDVCYGNPANAVNGDVWIPWTPVESDRIATHYDYSGSSQVYSYVPPVIPPSPKPQQFVADCNADATLTVNQRQNINIMALWYQSGAPALAQNIWTQVKAGATAPQITAIQQHGTDNNITLP